MVRNEQENYEVINKIKWFNRFYFNAIILSDTIAKLVNEL